MNSIPFNKPYLTGKEIYYIEQAITSGKVGGDGVFTKKCHEFFEKEYGFKKVLLTTSCTDALEMAAILLDIKPGDEIIAPSYTFVSTVNAFVLRGAKIVFADSTPSNPNIDADSIESLITPKTKVIVPMHYAGIACDMDKIVSIALSHNLSIVEDAAQAFGSYYKGVALGSLGDFSTFSFHETKNVISGEGGMLVINKEKYISRAEIIREKGTNRSAFFRGEVDKYGWVDVGSSFLPADIIAAFLYAQLENSKDIQQRRMSIWRQYHESLKFLEKENKAGLPFIPEFATNNAHMFYLVCNTPAERTSLIKFLKQKGISAVFHYQSLHNSPYYKHRYDGPELKYSDRYSDCLLRLPFYYELKNDEIAFVVDAVLGFYKK